MQIAMYKSLKEKHSTKMTPIEIKIGEHVHHREKIITPSNGELERKTIMIRVLNTM